jgi:hypothetical protein
MTDTDTSSKDHLLDLELFKKSRSSAAKIKYQHTEETTRSLSNKANHVTPHTEETKAKMSLSQKAAWLKRKERNV